MQPGQSQLFESLRVYLNNSRRQQPVIGLDSVTECVTAGAMNRELLYICNVCVCRCSKSDIRSHIFGSHHRFNYIKAWYPELLMAWQEDSDLSAMAWPLMELAKMVEKKEGPGQAQLVEVGEALYQKMATLSEVDAVSLITVLSGSHTEVVSCGDTTASPRRPSQPARTVLPGGREEPVQDDAPSLQTSCESSENPGFLDADTRTEPLIGLLYVVEYRSVDGSSSCFLCHCCRVSSTKNEIIDHLTGSPHLINYLRETCPEQVEAASAEAEVLQSLALKVQQDDCRGTLKVVNVPESLCRRLAAESYHCCLKILRGEWKNTDAPENKDNINESGDTEKSPPSTPRSNNELSTRRTVEVNDADTMFTVSLPLSAGRLLIERTSFAEDDTSWSPSADLDQIDYPESEPGLLAGDDDSAQRGPSRFQDDLRGEDVRGDVPRKNLNVTLFCEVHGSYSENHNQCERVPEMCDTRNNNNLLFSLETQSEAPNDEVMPAAPYFPPYTRRDAGEAHCYVSPFNGRTETDVPRVEEYARESSSVPHYNQQLLCYQYRAGWAPGLPARGPYGQSNNVYDPLPGLTAARTHMLAQFGDNGVEPERRERLHQTQQGPLQTYWQFGAHWT